jgi:hypothetical protein
VTVAQWISRQAPPPPDALLGRVIELVGRDGDRPAETTPEVCLAAASSHLASIVGLRRYGRESALDLLAIDALVTYAFEHASSVSHVELERFSRDAVSRLGAVTHNHE